MRTVLSTARSAWAGALHAGIVLALCSWTILVMTYLLVAELVIDVVYDEPIEQPAD